MTTGKYDEVRLGTPGENMRIMNRLLDEGIRPHAGDIARIGRAGHVVVVVFEPGENWRTKVLPFLGWHGEAVFRMPRSGRERFATSDPVTKAWLQREWTDGDPLRLFVIAHDGSLLVNYAPGVGFSLEPGSTDAELAGWRGSLN